MLSKGMLTTHPCWGPSFSSSCSIYSGRKGGVCSTQLYLRDGPGSNQKHAPSTLIPKGIRVEIRGGDKEGEGEQKGELVTFHSVQGQQTPWADTPALLPRHPTPWGCGPCW